LPSFSHRGWYRKRGRLSWVVRRDP
jgi:hypothetical protein